jgi:hypothetical protein
VAVTFEGGACEEDPRLHGVTAMLAAVLADGCRAIVRDELGAQPSALGVELEALVEPERWGLSFTAPRERWAELSYIAPRCVETLRATSARVEAARLSLVDRWPLRAELARALAPDAPGGVFVAGRPSTRAGVEALELRRWFAEHAVARRARVGVAGDARADVVARRLAEGLSRLPEGAGFEAARWTGAPDELRGVHRDEGIEVAVGWTADADPAAPAAGRAFARAVGARLGGLDGVRSLWAEGGGFGGRTFAAVGLRVSPEALQTLPAQLHAASTDLPLADLAARIDAQQEEARAWRGGTPRSLARALAEGDAPAPTALEPLLRAMAAARPVVVVARPQPGQR